MVNEKSLCYNTKLNPKDIKIPFKSLSKLPSPKNAVSFDKITLFQPEKGILKIRVPLKPDTWEIKSKGTNQGMIFQIYTLLFDSKAKYDLKLTQPINTAPLSPRP